MLQITVVPFTVVGIDFSNEMIHPGYTANLKDDYPGFKDEQPELVPKWVIEYGAPSAFQKWERSQREKEKNTDGAAGQPSPPATDRAR